MLDADHFGHRLLDVFEADRAHLALRLRDDVRWIEPLEHIRKNAIDGDRRTGQRLDPFVDLAAGAVDVDLGFGAGRQGEHLGREIALVRTPDQIPPETECRDNFGRTGDQRHNSGFGSRLRHRFVSGRSRRQNRSDCGTAIASWRSN